MDNALRKLPSLDALLRSEQGAEICQKYTEERAKKALKSAIGTVREAIKDGKAQPEDDIFKIAIKSLSAPLQARRVINASGIALHTNLGRAPLSAKAQAAVIDAFSYQSLEYSLETGERIPRGADAEALICKLTNTEAALCVNNNAAALLLCLSAMTNGGAVAVSRGELVEIGGSFRIRDIIELCGSAVIEVGATNRTHRSDFARAVAENNASLLLKVHTSNYKINGYTCEVGIKELKNLNVPILADIGSGAILQNNEYPFYEYGVHEAVSDGADIVCFSADKLLGSAQGGIICGKKIWIDKMKKHPLARAVRIDKLCLAAITATLSEYLSPSDAKKSIPVLQMLCGDTNTLLSRAEKLCEKLNCAVAHINAFATTTKRPVGGGSVPLAELCGAAIVIKCKNPQELCAALRTATVPVIAFVRENSLFLDIACVQEHEENELLQSVVSIL